MGELRRNERRVGLFDLTTRVTEEGRAYLKTSGGQEYERGLLVEDVARRTLLALGAKSDDLKGFEYNNGDQIAIADGAAFIELEVEKSGVSHSIILKPVTEPHRRLDEDLFYAMVERCAVDTIESLNRRTGGRGDGKSRGAGGQLGA